jgi:hypothetical protein
VCKAPPHVCSCNMQIIYGSLPCKTPVLPVHILRGGLVPTIGMNLSDATNLNRKTLRQHIRNIHSKVMDCTGESPRLSALT